jgi:hypothetical protein
MRYPLLIGAVLVFATSAAWAQDRSRDYGDDQGTSWSDRGSSDRDWGEGRGDRMDRMHDRMGGRMGYGYRHRDRGSDAARFYIRSGDTRLAVRCDERESMRSCVDTALMALDRMRTQANTTSSSPTAPSSPPATTAPTQPR